MTIIRRPARYTEGVVRLAKGCLILCAVYILYFHGLDHVGLLGPDEPRYAAIGREMARTGDWITPRLWGEPWFEKPPLLYWMVAVAVKFGFGQDLAPRLPVALLSVGFLLFYWRMLHQQMGDPAASYATLILGTSAGWVAYSRVAVTDLPMAAAFGAALLLACDWLRSADLRRLFWAGLCLGLAILAKGFVPVVLSLPLLWLGRRHWRQLWRLALGAVLVAGPWYALVGLRHGRVFFEDFILKHHLERFASESLQHVQPFWYYAPVLLAGLVPWTPLLALVRAPEAGSVRAFYLWWAAFGLLFFSLSVNKLPGYLLPLLPAVCALLGATLHQARGVRTPMVAAGALAGLAPAVAEVLPAALADGLSTANWRLALLGALPWMAAGGALMAAVEWRLGRRFAAACVAAAAACGVLAVQSRTYPLLNETVSARGRWETVQHSRSEICLESPRRAFRYGMNYYAGAWLPDCRQHPKSIRLSQ